MALRIYQRPKATAPSAGPAVTVSGRQIRLSAAAVAALGRPRNVHLLVDDTNRHLYGIAAVAAPTPGSYRVAPGSGNITCARFIADHAVPAGRWRAWRPRQADIDDTPVIVFSTTPG